MSGITLTNEIKANIASYMTEVMLPDMFEGTLRERDNEASIYAGFFGISGSGLGAASTLLPIFAANPVTVAPWVAALAIGAFGSTVLQMLASKNVSSELARVQADNAYWYMVKRRIYCGLPASTDPADFTEATRERLANEVENIVPYNGADFASKTSANNLVASLIRALPVEDLRGWLEAASLWDGNSSGISTLPDLPNGCGADVAMVPVIGDSGTLPFSEQISANTWRIGTTTPGDYKWRTAYPDQCYRIDAVTIAEAPLLNPQFPIITYTKCDGFSGAIYDLSDLVGICFRDLIIQSGVPFSLYVTISECSGQPATDHPAAFVRFATNQQLVTEGQTATVAVKLFSSSPLTAAVTVDVTLEGISTAIIGSDFTFQSPAQITFPVGSVSGTSQNVSISIASDVQQEDVERIVLRLTNLTGGAVTVEPSVHMVAIDNVPAPWCVRLDLTQSAYAQYFTGNGVSHNSQGYVGTGSLRFDLGGGYTITGWTGA